MRSNDGYDEDYDDTEEFAYDRSRALQKLLDEHRSKERIRHANRSRDYSYGRMRRDDWHWDDDDFYGQY